jgi:aryl-alcohol dehydrogenase-like predicted oxidoreductase
LAKPLDPAVEPAPAQLKEILGKVAVDRSGGAKFNLAGMAQRAVAGLSRKAIFAEIDNSLRRLGMDYVDLYQIPLRP